MNTEDYISSGIIELFVLGLTSEEESKQVQQLAAENDAIRTAIDDYQKALESYTSAAAIAPRDSLKSQILEKIKNEKESNKIKTSEKSAADNIAPLVSVQRWKKFTAAAAILLSISLLLNVIYISKYKHTRDNYSNLLASQQQYASQNKAMETRLNDAEANLKLLMNPHVQSISMSGVPAHSELTAIVYWDSKNRQAYLGRSNLPVPPEGKEYQLWAIIDGKPVDMGMIGTNTINGLMPMKKASQGTIQAFAVTLEKRGGSTVPTLDQMYVMGKI